MVANEPQDHNLTRPRSSSGYTLQHYNILTLTPQLKTNVYLEESNSNFFRHVGSYFFF
jgi:hypothetical protein